MYVLWFSQYFSWIYYVTFQRGWLGIFKKNHNDFSTLKQKIPKKVAYLWQLGVFFLYSPDCPKQPRISFPFYKLLYTTISCRISDLKAMIQRKTFFSPYKILLIQRRNSILLLWDLFSFVFWRKLKTPKGISKLTDLYLA